MSRFTAALVSIFLLILILLLLTGILVYLKQLDPSTYPTVQYIIPSGFRGSIRVTNVEQELRPSQDSEGVYVIKVPESGVVSLSLGNLLSEWHETSACYSDGSSLALGITLLPEDTSIEAFWDLFATGDGQYWYYVGTRDEMISALHSVELKPGSPFEEENKQERLQRKASPTE